MTYPRVYASSDGGSHFQDVAVAQTPTVYVRGIPLVDVSPSYAARALTFSHLAAGYTSDWHHAPRWQFVVILSGAMAITVSDGEVRDFRPGSVFLVEDTTGKGHRTRARGTDECFFVTVALTPHNKR
jgi:quercetin dioxygenase-like cupin family protein